MHNRQAVNLGMLWRSAMKDYDMWPIYLIGLSWAVPYYPSTQYITLLLKSDGFDTFTSNLLTIPNYVLSIIGLLFFAWLSKKVNERLLVCLSNEFWSLILLIALEFLPGGKEYKWGRYTCTMLLAAAPYVHPIIVAMTSRNAGSVRTRTVASALYNMSVQASNIIGSNVYRNDDAPLYRKGNKGLIILCVYNIVIIVSTKAFYMYKNRFVSLGKGQRLC